MMDAGQISITVSGTEVTVSSTRPQVIPALFHGRNPAFVVGAIPRLYAVCNRAQTLASRLCLGAAAGEDVDVGIPSTVVAEALREHLMRIAVDWSNSLGYPAPSAEDLRQIHRLPEVAALHDRNLVSEEAGRLLMKWVAPRQLICAGIEELAEQPTVAGKLLANVLEAGWAGRGRTETYPGSERTVLSLLDDDPGLEEAQREWGNALVVRLYARLLHAARLSEVLTGQRLPAIVETGASSARASVTTSRGMLIHSVQLAGGLISNYEISAPTDVNFTPEGPVKQVLQACVAFGDESLEDIARLLVVSLDPCVNYDLRVQ